ncbi:hypothetical protein NDU88_001358 [Pleurodeles waltl]|uniref:Uncharacterized protein n=1 Tax=Pleurodeles waltl TaxID=8319 RepID=A0AAV7UTT4_PLEWA|nr:hypothetical protein NDU88_001358 [Pleurodeles waltl]
MVETASPGPSAHSLPTVLAAEGPPPLGDGDSVAWVLKASAGPQAQDCEGVLIRPPTRGPEASLHSGEALQRLAGPRPQHFPTDGLEDESPGWGGPSPEPELAWEASNQPRVLSGPLWCGSLEEGSFRSRAWPGLVGAQELGHSGEASLGPTGPGAGCLATRWAGGQSPGYRFPSRPLARVLDGAPEHDLAEEAYPGQPGDLDAP